MRILVGCEMTYDFTQPTPLIAVLNVHPSRVSDLERPDYLLTEPAVPVQGYRDGFGNWCNRLTAPAGRFTLRTNTVVRDAGNWDPVTPNARETPIDQLPSDALEFLLGSRYCETDKLSNIAWNLFQNTPPGWARVQAICDFVHNHITFGYQFSRPTRTAAEAFEERQGVCRDYAHLCVALLRARNVPARLVSVYAPGLAPMDFHAVAEAYVDGAWHVVDATTLAPRSTMVRIATGRDASDTAFLTTQRGGVDFHSLEVTAVVDELPNDDVTALVRLG